MIYAFQDLENLYLVLDFQSGGDLRYHQLRSKKTTKFTENQTSFIIIRGLYNNLL